MARLTPRFSTNRSVREYTERYYVPAAAAYRARAADKGAVGSNMVAWEHTLKEKWVTLRFGDVKVETKGNQHAWEVQVHLNDLDPKMIRVELYAAGVNAGAPARQEMKCVRQLAPGIYVYSAAVSAARPPADYTARIIPHDAGVAVPLEVAPILWQR
jgi:starch phosphorylase